MSALRVGIIGCGQRGIMHAVGYASGSDATIVACADPVEDKAKALAEALDVPNVYTDYRQMLRDETLDMVSVCTWIALHTEMIVAAAASGVKAVFSEKPMAPTWGEAKRQVEACVKHGVQLTYSHQRRFDPRFYKAKQLAGDGAIGRIVRLEGTCPNLFDWGTHWFDMFFFYNDEQPAASVIGQIDAAGGREVFGTPVEGSGLAWIQWQNGVQGLMVTGGAGSIGGTTLTRIIGADGVIEVGEGGKPLRVLTTGSGWQEPDTSDVPFRKTLTRVMDGIETLKAETGNPLKLGPAGNIAATAVGVVDAIECLKTGKEPMLAGRRALQATELIFATYESSRRRAKVDLPLGVDDSAFLAMLADGTLERG